MIIILKVRAGNASSQESNNLETGDQIKKKSSGGGIGHHGGTTSTRDGGSGGDLSARRRNNNASNIMFNLTNNKSTNVYDCIAVILYW